jgi:hypothetical protein
MHTSGARRRIKERATFARIVKLHTNKETIDFIANKVMPEQEVLPLGVPAERAGSALL